MDVEHRAEELVRPVRDWLVFNGEGNFLSEEEARARHLLFTEVWAGFVRLHAKRSKRRANPKYAQASYKDVASWQMQ